MTRPKRVPMVHSIRWRVVNDTHEIEAITAHDRVTLEDPLFPDEYKQRDYDLRVDELREDVLAGLSPDASASRKTAGVEAQKVLTFITTLQAKLLAHMKRFELRPDDS